MSDEIIGMILSLVGLVLNVSSFQIKNKKILLVFQMMGSAVYLVSYIFADGGIGAVLNGIFLARNLLFMLLDGKKGRPIYISAVMLCVIYAAAYAAYTLVADLTLQTNLWNLLPIIGAVFGTISFSNSDPIKLRIWKYFDSASWLAFNIHIGLGALGGVFCEVLSIVSLTVAIARFRREKKIV